MATRFKFLGRSHDGSLATLPADDRARMQRNAVAAAERLRASGEFTTQMQDIREAIRQQDSTED